MKNINMINILIIILLVSAIGIGAMNLKVYSSLKNVQSGKPANLSKSGEGVVSSEADIRSNASTSKTQNSTANVADADKIDKPAENPINKQEGSFVWADDDTVSLLVDGKKFTAALKDSTGYYIRETMSNDKYQAALKELTNNRIISRQENENGGYVKTSPPPQQDAYRMVKSLDEMNLRQGDKIEISYSGEFNDNKTAVETLVKMTEIK